MELPSDVLAAIRESCMECARSSDITINRDRYDSFLNDIEESVWQKQSQSHGLTLPLTFESQTDEINLLSTISLLNFLHAYRLPLKARTGKGAYDFILTLCLGGYLSDEPTFLDTKSMTEISIAKLASLGNIKTHIEKRHESLPVTIGQKDEEVFEILGLVEKALKTTGEFLKNANAPSLGHWVESIHREVEGNINAMLRRIAQIPAFADIHHFNRKNVYILKKACFLIHAVSHRLPMKGGPLPIFVDNVIPTMLVHHGLITLPASITPPSLTEQQATQVRAASVVACYEIVKRANELGKEGQGAEWMGKMTEVELDGYLWSTAKLGDTRKIERLVERGTLFY